MAVPKTPHQDWVPKHVELYQNVIARMSRLGASCKTWCLGLVSGILLFALKDGQPCYGLLGLLPLGMFWVLNTYYLTLERGFRSAYNSFVRGLHDPAGSVDTRLFEMMPEYGGAPPMATTPGQTEGGSAQGGTSGATGRPDWVRTFVRPEMLLFYGLLAVIVLVVVAATSCPVRTVGGSAVSCTTQNR